MSNLILPACSLTQREVVRFLRQRNRVFSALGQPIFFFVLFGFTVLIAEVAHVNVLLLGALLLAVTYLMRAVFLSWALRMDLKPLLYVTPRGLISILLYFSLPQELRMSSVGLGLLFVMVLTTCVVMALGLLGATTEKSEGVAAATASEPQQGAEAAE